MANNPTPPNTLPHPEEAAQPAWNGFPVGQPLMSEHVFRAMCEQAPESIGVYDMEGSIIWVNEAFSRLLARTLPPEFARMTLQERAERFKWQDVQGRPLVKEDLPVSRVLRGEVLYGAQAVESRGLARDGNIIYLNTTGAPLRNAAGQIVGAVCAHRDVTEYQRLRQELTTRVRELETIYEAMTDGVLVLDQEARIIFANRAFRALFGLASQEDVARFYAAGAEERQKLTAMCDWSGRPLSPEELAGERLLRGEVLSGPTTLNVQIRSLDGSERFLSVTGAAIRGANGQIARAVAVYRDVTEQRKAQEEQSQLLNFIAHELSTPLTTLKGQAQLAKRRLGRGEPMTLQQLEQFEHTMKRMERLVSDLLDSTRLERDRLELHLTTLNLIPLCEQVAEEQMLTSGRFIQLDLPGQPVLIQGDAMRLAQVLANLLSNALKYSPSEATVILRLRQQEREVRVEVEDHGPGIAPEAQPRLFERFYRAPGARVLHGSGVSLGLGLYLSQQLVKLHDGEIGVSSIVGKGSTFWFTMPLSQENAL